MQIAKNCVVSLQYTLTNDKGKLLDSTPPGEAMDYIHGAAGILPALERHLAGKKAGDTFDLTIPPEGGFGDRQPGLTMLVPTANWDHPEQLSVGMTATRTDPDGQTRDYIITAIDDQVVTVDANHPLAGMTLRFKGTVVDVRPATAEELASV